MPLVAEAHIVINAPIEKVWQVMLNTSAYGEWNPFVYKVDAEGDPAVPGSKMRLFVKWATGGKQTSNELIEEVKAPYKDISGAKKALWSYRFIGPLAAIGAVKAIRYQWLTQQPKGVTQYQTREEFSGWLVNFIPLKKVQAGFELHAKALAARAEGF